jgi:hypothetical protein
MICPAATFEAGKKHLQGGGLLLAGKARIVDATIHFAAPSFDIEQAPAKRDPARRDASDEKGNQQWYFGP